MFTLHHGFWIYFISRSHHQVWQFVLGSMLPDYVYFVMVGIMILEGRLALLEVLHLDPLHFSELIPFYPWVGQTDLILHSVVYWGLAFLTALLPLLNRLQAFIIGWGTHLLLDTFTHGAEANYYLYPLSWERVHGPVSYWEPDYFAHEYKMVHSALLVMAIVYLAIYWLRKKKLK